MSRKATDQVTTIYSDGADGSGYALISHTEPKTANVRVGSKSEVHDLSAPRLECGDEPTLARERRLWGGKRT